MSLIGETAALATAVCFAISALVFGATGKLVGAQVTNRVRLLFALLFLGVLNLILFREPLPFSAESSHWIWLSLSGVIGYALGDAFLFQSYVTVGPRLGILLLSTAPIFGSVIAWVFFGETLTVLQIAGIVVTLVGIAWVVWLSEEPADTPHGNMRLGVFFGLLGGLGQAVGLVFSKQGMMGDFDPFRANAIRLLAATRAIWLVALVGNQGGATMDAVRQKPQALGLLALGAFIGPVLGVCASLVAVANADIGVASTLMALSPVLLLPVSVWVFKERVGWGAVAGTLLAFAGVATLFIA